MSFEQWPLLPAAGRAAGGGSTKGAGVGGAVGWGRSARQLKWRRNCHTFQWREQRSKLPPDHGQQIWPGRNSK